MSAQRHKARVALALILLAAFALRGFRLEAQSLWYDEGVTAWVARLPLAQMVRWTANDIQPPLYYALVALWGQVAGWSEAALRFVSLFWGVLSVALLYATARGMLRRVDGYAQQSEPVALWAALIAATHPLLVYYSQEARMYTLGLALGLLAAWLLAPALFGPMPARRWIVYALAAALAIYTHYFVAFLIAALALVWLAQGGQRRSGARRFWFAHLLVALLYLPWVAVVVRRLAVDASYWQGDLKLGEALRSVAIRFVAGETVRDTAGSWVALAAMTVTAAGCLWLWRRTPSPRPVLRLALIWLLLPTAAALALATFVPKFNPRYVLFALPGLLLIWALLLEALSRGRTRVLGLLAAGAMIAVFVWSSGNWFFDGNFAKAQWRQLADFLVPRLEENERVVLVSGHAWPVWDYYAPEVEPVRLPALDVLDVNEVLTFESTAAPLRAGLNDDAGAWFVGWQDEVVDPNEVVTTQLEIGGREKGSSAVFSQLTVRRFSRIREHRIADSPPLTVSVGVTFGDLVTLDGYRPLDNGDLLLFWHLGEDAPPAADYHVALEVLDTTGTSLAQVADRRLGGYTYPTFRWLPGEIVMGRTRATDWLGPEPQVGEHTLRVRVYDAADPSLTRLLLPDGTDTLTITGVDSIIE